MTYDRALEVLRFSKATTHAQRVEMAKGCLERRVPGTPLRYGVACRTIIRGQAPC